MKLFLQKMQNFRALAAPPPDPRASGGWGLCPQTPSLRRLGLRPRPQNSPPPHCQFLATRLGEYKAKFPKDLLNKVRTIHGPLFDYSRFENEVYVLYRSNDFVRKHARKLITFIKSVNLQPGFSEVYKLRQLIWTIPSKTASAERNFPLWSE